MKMKSLIITLVLFLLIGCSSSTEPTSSSLSVTEKENYLTISNNSNETVYLFVVEKGSAALINWSTHFENPKITANSSINIDFENIYGLNQPINTGDKVIVYFWYKSDETNPEIYTKVVEL